MTKKTQTDQNSSQPPASSPSPQADPMPATQDGSTSRDTSLPKGDPRVITDLISTVHRLRAPGGCPWDIKQTHQSLRRYLLEEAHETIDVLDQLDQDTRLREDPTLSANLREELGDVWMQVLLHSQLANELGAFNIFDVAQTLNDKLIRRHPHVFGASSAAASQDGSEVTTPEQVISQWEKIKLEEKRQKAAQSFQTSSPGLAAANSPQSEPLGTNSAPVSALDGLAKGLPALQKATRVIERVTRVGFQWPDLVGPLQKIDEEIGEFKEALEKAGSPPSPEAKGKLEDELGDLLFSLCNVASFLGLSPEDALRGTLQKFERRFRHVEHRLHAVGRSPSQSTLEEMDRFWDEAKRLERKPAQGSPNDQEPKGTSQETPQKTPKRTS